MGHSFTVPATPLGGFTLPPDMSGVTYPQHRADYLRVYDLTETSPDAGSEINRLTVPLSYAQAATQGLMQRVKQLQDRLANRGRKPSEATRAKYERMKQLREKGKTWAVVASKLGYKDARSAANHFRALRRKFDPA